MINGLDQNLEFCLSANNQCEKLNIPPSNKMEFDKCNMYGTFIDRNSRQKPIRCASCLADFPIEGY